MGDGKSLSDSASRYDKMHRKFPTQIRSDLMKKATQIVATVGLAVALSSTADAVVNIQNIGAGARSSSLGNAFVAVADNGDALFSNPAGLGQIEQGQLSYTNVSILFSGIDGDNLGQHVASYARPLGSRMSLGLGYERIGSDLMSENGAFFGLSYRLNRNLHLGVTGKYVFWAVDDFDPDDPVSGQSQGAIGADVGLLWNTPFRDAKLGVQYKNALAPNVACGASCSDDPAATNATLKSDDGDLPSDLNIGVSFSVAEASMLSVQWAMRDLSGETESRLVVGGETVLVEGLMLRAGGSRIFEDDASGDLNAGLGYSWSKMLFDYGYHIPLDLTETNGSHRISLVRMF